MLEVDVAEPLRVKRSPADEEGHDHGSEEQEHPALVALLTRALSKKEWYIQALIEKNIYFDIPV